MSTLPYPRLPHPSADLHKTTALMGGIEDPFMSLSFLALTVIPALRITDRGPFDSVAFRDCRFRGLTNGTERAFPKIGKIIVPSNGA